MKGKTTRYYILFLLLIIPFFKTEYLALFPSIVSIFDVLKITSLVISFLILLFSFRIHKKISKQLIIIIIFSFCVLISTIINKAEIINAANFAVTLISLAIIFEYGLKHFKIFLSTLLFVCEVFIYINFITIMLYPDGMYATETLNLNWFFGNRNTHIVYFLLALLLSYLYSKYNRQRVRTLILYIVIFISALWTWSATTLVGLFVTLLIFVPIIRKKYKILNYRTYFVIYIIFFVTVIFFKLQNYFNFLIVDVLQKDLSFTYRDDLWSTTIAYVKNSPIIGCGWQSIEFRHKMYYSSSIISAHNQILEYAFLGGIVLVVLYFVILFFIDKRMMKHKDNEIVQKVSVFFLALQLLWFSEVYFNVLIYFVLLVCMYITSILKKYEQND